MIPTEPGIYHDLPFEDYRAIKAFNSSLFKHPTNRHLKAALDGKIPDKDSQALRFGREVHCRLLEPERYASEVIVSTPCQAINGRGEVCGATGKLFDPISHQWFCGIKSHAPPDAYTPKDYVKAEEAEAIEEMAESLHSHEVMNLFRCPGWCELTVVFEFDGHLLKARTDKFSAIGPEHFGGRPTIIDIKKGIAGKLDRDTCRKKILEYGWHRQASIYVDALEYHGHKDVQFAWIFIEDGPPFDINIVVASSTDIEIGRSEYRSTLRSYATAVKQGKYLGYVYSIKAIEPGALPDWYVDRWERAHKQGDNGADYEPVSSGDGF